MLVSADAAHAAALDDPYAITAAERAACTDDATRFCAWTYPDEQKLLACMKQNRASLSATCGPVFDAGVRRRRH